MTSLITILSLVFIASPVTASSCTTQNDPLTGAALASVNQWAVCTMIGEVYGNVYMRYDSSIEIEVRPRLGGLSPGEHGMSIHQEGNLFTETEEEKCGEVGAIYDVRGDTSKGDLGNICVNADGLSSDIFKTDTGEQLGDLYGLSLVVYDSAGMSGNVIGCCVIGKTTMWTDADVQIGLAPKSPDSDSDGAARNFALYPILVTGLWIMLQ